MTLEHAIHTAVLAVVLGLLALFASCCGPNAEAKAADSVARIANAGAPLLIEAYKADTSPYAELKWERVWAAWDAFRLAHDAYATSIEQGAQPSPETMLKSFCSLVGITPEPAKSRIQIVGVCP